MTDLFAPPPGLDLTWLQRPGWGRELAAVLRAVSSSVEGAPVGLLWRVAQPTPRSTLDTNLLGMSCMQSIWTANSGNDDTPSSLIKTMIHFVPKLLSDPESNFYTLLSFSAIGVCSCHLNWIALICSSVCLWPQVIVGGGLLGNSLHCPDSGEQRELEGCGWLRPSSQRMAHFPPARCVSLREGGRRVVGVGG